MTGSEARLYLCKFKVFKLYAATTRNIPKKELESVMVKITVNRSTLIQIGILALALLLFPSSALAAGSIDDGGMRAYKKIFSVGKWIIIGKWALDAIQCALNGDYDGIKQKSIAYAACVALIILIPTMVFQIEEFLS
ncbi:MAG: hypothetical protein ACYDEJ_03090 [Desulfitobacteriaceae bacterium]